MKTYIVTLESKDKHVYETKIESETDESAVNKALEDIKTKGWDIYEYKLKQLERII